MAQTVAGILVEALEQIGVTHIFGLIGDSLNALGDAVRRSKIQSVGVRHEEGGALAAAGQAKLTGRLGVCAGRTGHGSNHLVAGLYEACRDHAPVLALSGDMPRKFHGTDYFQTSEPDLLFRDVSLFTQTILAPDQAPAIIHQAIAAAYAGRGVAHLTLPQDVLVSKASSKVPSLATLRPKEEFPASEQDIAEIAQRIDAAETVAIMCGNGCHGAAEELVALSDRLKAPLIHTVKGKDIMPYDHPRWMGGIGMIGTRPNYLAAQRCDVLLMLGTDYPYSNYLPGKGSAIQIDERAEVLGRRAPTAFAAAGSIKPSVKLLLNKVAEKQDNSFFERVSRERREWDEKLDRQADLSRSADRIHPQAVARTVGELAAKDAIFVLDTGLNPLWSANYIRQSGSQRIIGSFNNGAVGTAVGQANGIQALDKSRQVIALCGDGGFNMLMSEFLTATHYKLPVKVIVYDNSAFGLITLGIDFPNPDYVGLAQACGGHGFKAQKPEELEPAIREALKTDGPAIVDAVVVANEIPNIPDLELELPENYAMAKVKEAVLAFTGG